MKNKRKQIINTKHNLLLHGDNLQAFPLLYKFKEKIKLVYLDPPYNTGKKFKHYDDKLSHDEWINMMRVRLKNLKTFLKDDGSIWISIDDDELHYLRILCDEIFDRKNFIATIIWQKKSSPSNDSRYISDSHDYILVYAKNKKNWKCNLLPRTKEANERYRNVDYDARGLWTSSDLTVKTPSDKYIYPIKTPSGRIVLPPEGRSWSMPMNKFLELVKDNRIWFGEEGSNVPRLKRFLNEVQNGLVPKTLWLSKEVGDNQSAKKEIIKINNKDIFTTPKPEKLIQRIIHLGTNEGDWVMDPFAGAGTTGAVAHKMNRKWVMMEINGVCESHCLPRLEKVISGDNIGISKEIAWSGGGSYDFINL